MPSLSLLSQTLTEWAQESAMPLHSFAVCSDGDVGKKRKKGDDVVQTFAHELRYPAATNPARLAAEMAKRHDAHHMSVVFSTYHSIEVISKAQLEHALADFDLIICDEAHRTTGATFGDDDESNFVKVHDADFIKSAKRLYMTATPRICGENAKAKAEADNVALCSMDNEAQYGKELYVINFSEAVRRELLVDYKVLVLAVSEDYISASLQQLLKSDDNQLKVDDAAKIIGCWKGLSKQDTQEDLVDDGEPMRRAVDFCQVIENTGKSKTHKVSSVNIASMFAKVVEAYKEQEFGEDLPSVTLQCEAEHVDGGMNACQKEEKLTWLKAESPENTCRILSNVLCLSGLYAIEEQGKDQTADQRAQSRALNSQSELQSLHYWLLKLRPNVANGGGLAQAIDYTLRRWPALVHYAETGDLPIDNNPIENAIRPIAIGKKNWLFAGSERAGKRAAAIQSLLATAKLNGIEPSQWMKSTLEKLPAWPNSRIDELLPLRG